MPTRGNPEKVRSNGRNPALSLELSLSRSAFATAGHMSGVVVLCLRKPINIRSMSVSIEGRESPSGVALSRAFRAGGYFFARETLLSGMEQPRLTSERVSQFWNAFLGRDTGRTLSAGKHVYPFAIPLPASLPPSYHGRAGTIDYTACARVQLPTGRTLKIARDVAVVSIPRAGRAQPIALSYPTAGGNVHTASVSADLELPDRAVALGSRITGRLRVANPNQTEIRRVAVSLESYEWVRPAAQKELQRQTLDEWVLEPGISTSAAIEAEFGLTAPLEAPPTVEGTAISVIWLLKLRIDADPLIELKTPITVFAPVSEP